MLDSCELGRLCAVRAPNHETFGTTSWRGRTQRSLLREIDETHQRGSIRSQACICTSVQSQDNMHACPQEERTREGSSACPLC